MDNDSKKAWKVITPAGNIYVDSASEANEYKRLYGFVAVRNNDSDYECDDYEE